MKICLDKDVVCELLTQGRRLGQAVICVDVALLRGFDVAFSALALEGIAAAAKSRRGENGQRAALAKMLEFCEVLDVCESDAARAISAEGEEFAAVLLVESCKRNKVDLIVSFEPRRFAGMSVTAIEPNDFLRAHEPEGYDYAELELRD